MLDPKDPKMTLLLTMSLGDCPVPTQIELLPGKQKPKLSIPQETPKGGFHLSGKPLLPFPDPKGQSPWTKGT